MTPTPALATVQALAITLLAILPGAAYTFAFERGRGAFGVTLADRVIRFLAASAVFHAVVAGTEYALYKHLIHTGALARAQIPWYTVQLIAVLYVAVPIAAGATVARASIGGRRWAALITGTSPDPRAWDYWWSRQPQGVLRAKLKSGTWVAGFYGRLTENDPRSYAAGFPASGSDQDLFVTHQLRVDAATGEWVRDSDGRATLGEGALLLRWDEIELLEFTEVDDDPPKQERPAQVA